MREYLLKTRKVNLTPREMSWYMTIDTSFESTAYNLAENSYYYSLQVARHDFVAQNRRTDPNPPPQSLSEGVGPHR